MEQRGRSAQSRLVRGAVDLVLLKLPQGSHDAWTTRTSAKRNAEEEGLF